MWNLQERLAWLSNERFVQANEVIVLEQAEQGEARVTFTSSEALICLNSPNNKPLYFLQERRLADGIVLQVNDQGASLHLVECKKTIKEKSWETVKAQWSGALQTALALCGVLGLPAPAKEQVFLYSAYRDDKLSPANNTNPVLLKMLVGANRSAPSPHVLEWQASSVNVLGKSFKHHKIKLDADGNGQFQIGV